MKKFKVSTAEKKILASFGYFTLLHITSSVLAAHFSNTFTQFSTKFNHFLLCARYDDSCLEPDLTVAYHPVGLILQWSVHACLPIFMLVYVIDCEKLKNSVKKKRDTLHIESAFASSKAQAGQSTVL